MKVIQMKIEELLSFRESVNKELYCTPSPDNLKMQYYVQAEPGILMEAQCDNHTELVTSLAPYVNKMITTYDRRALSHDLTDNTSWSTPTNSICKIESTPGNKFVVTSLQIRFPRHIKITAANYLYFRVYLDIPGMGLIPVINTQYTSLRDLVKKTGNPLRIPAYAVQDVSTEELIEMEFVYADPHTLKGAPVVLRHSHGEYIELGLSANLPLTRVDDTAYGSTDECWAVFNGKTLVDF